MGQWRLWVKVRDAVAPDHPARYPEDQVMYHYNCLDGEERAKIRSRYGGSRRRRLRRSKQLSLVLLYNIYLLYTLSYIYATRAVLRACRPIKVPG
jgi:hypothetical protein